MSLPRHWLAMRLGAMGDVLLTTGVLEHFRAARGMRFIVLTKAPWGQLFLEHPAVDAIVEFEGDELRTAGFAQRARQLAREHQGAGLLDLHGTLRSRLLALFWKGAVRRYPKFSLQRRLAMRLRSQALLRRLEAVSVPQRYAMALETQPPSTEDLAPRIWLGQDELEQASELLAQRIPAARGCRVAALHPFATHENKRWPEQHWHEIRDLLLVQGWGVCVIGRGELQQPLAQDRQEGAEWVADLRGQTTPRQSAALLACADVLITADSGPMHLATAVGTPLVALFGPTTRAWGFAPVSRRDGGRSIVLERDLDCRPCSLHGRGCCDRGRECLAGISPHEVLQAALDVTEHESIRRD